MKLRAFVVVLLVVASITSADDVDLSIDWRAGIEHTSDTSSIAGGTYGFAGIAALSMENMSGLEFRYSFLAWPDFGTEHLLEVGLRAMFDNGLESSLGYITLGYALEAGTAFTHHIVLRWCLSYEITTASAAAELLPVTLRISLDDASPSLSIALFAVALGSRR